MSTPDWKEAAEKWLRDNNWDYQKYGDRRGDRSAYDTLMNYEIKEYLADAFQAGAAHACEQLEQDIAERDARIVQLEKDWQEARTARWAFLEAERDRTCIQLKQRLDVAIEALQRIDLQPDEIGMASDDASDEHQACWHIAHEALYQIAKHAGGES